MAKITIYQSHSDQSHSTFQVISARPYCLLVRKTITPMNSTNVKLEPICVSFFANHSQEGCEEYVIECRIRMWYICGCCWRYGHCCRRGTERRSKRRREGGRQWYGVFTLYHIYYQWLTLFLSLLRILASLSSPLFTLYLCFISNSP